MMDDRSSQRKPKANRHGLQRFCVTQISNYNLGLAYYEKEMQGRDGERCYRLSKFGFVHQFYSGMYNKITNCHNHILHYYMYDVTRTRCTPERSCEVGRVQAPPPSVE